VDLGLFDLKITKRASTCFLELGISVEGNRTTTVDVKLQVGGNETVVKVECRDRRATIERSPLRGGNIQSRRVSRLPLRALNPISLAGTLPGTVSPSGSTTYGKRVI